MEKFTILVADDDRGQLDLAHDLLDGAGHRVVTEQDPRKVFELVVREDPDLVLLDVMMPHLTGFDLCRQLKGDNRTRAIPVIFVTACYKDVKDKVFGLELGADDYVVKPYEIDELLARVNATLRTLSMQRHLIAEEIEKARLQDEVTELQQRLEEHREAPSLVAGSPGMQAVMKLAQTVADTGAHLLITGETGTGKGVLAETIHRLSGRARGTYVKVDCSVLTPSLLESELFGHERGAFTGAVKTREGRFERASGGTIFLDEIGELPLDLQVKLLRVVQDMEFERVGGDRTLKVDVRVIAATNVDLERAVSEGKFRRDLYYRLNVIPIRLPPLRERLEDVPPLAGMYLERFAARSRKAVKTLSKDAMQRLLGYHWPGNIRELEHVIERAVLLTAQDCIPPESILLDFSAPGNASTPSGPALPPSPMISLDELQRAHITRVLDHTRGNKKQASEILGISRNTLYEKLKSFGIAVGSE
ncbi:MAG: sigma-54-dependent Fis family transcriptional regulator [Candidatus Wallbacteria bacterium]|nr:sigma-54-dependent Fis family transcriptional regulator [Candidatus Wallbacteria bacterium]